jgi:hypothetical protein
VTAPTGIPLDVGVAGLDTALDSSLPYGLGTGALIVIVTLLATLVLYDLVRVSREPEDSWVRAYLDELLLVIVPLLLTFLSYVLFASFRVLE